MTSVVLTLIIGNRIARAVLQITIGTVACLTTMHSFLGYLVRPPDGPIVTCSAAALVPTRPITNARIDVLISFDARCVVRAGAVWIVRNLIAVGSTIKVNETVVVKNVSVVLFPTLALALATAIQGRLNDFVCAPHKIFPGRPFGPVADAVNWTSQLVLRDHAEIQIECELAAASHCTGIKEQIGHAITVFIPSTREVVVIATWH